MRYLIILLLLTGCSIFGSKDECGDTFRYIIDGDATNVTVKGYINGKLVVDERSVDLPWESKEFGIEIGDALEIIGRYSVGPGDMFLTFKMEDMMFGGSYHISNPSEDSREGRIEYILHEDIPEKACNT